MEGNKVIPVKVALRSRPLVAKERNEGCRMCIEFISNEPQVVVGTDKAFTFDFVFNPASSQESVYVDVVKPLVQAIFNGYNATILAYGQTGSGKTYTMGTVYDPMVLCSNDKLGIIPRAIKEIFAGIEDRKNYQFNVHVTFLEIYNEEVLDLLISKNKSRDEIIIREDTNGELKVVNLTEIKVENLDDTLKCLEQGSLSRTTGATAMNMQSSRSHAIFTLHVEQFNGDTCIRSKFHMVDLAGSERAKKTRAQGERFKEGVNINRGLLALGNVISALCTEGKNNHVPYRDSKLTRLLQDSLGGNSHTAMIACISPADSNTEETVNTLRYADRARKIKNKPIINRDPHEAELARLRKLVQDLQLQAFGNSGCGDTKENVSDSTIMIEKIQKLERENQQLAKELQYAVNRNGIMYEKAILAEERREKLKIKLSEICRKTGITMDSLNMSLNASMDIQLKDQLDILREVHDQVVDLQLDQNQTIREMRMIDETERNEDDVQASPGDEITMQYSIKQARFNRKLEDLDKELGEKEELMDKLEENDEKFQQMKQQYEDTLKDLEEQIAHLQKEKERARHNSVDNKVPEQNKKRLQELETEVAHLKKKMAEQNNWKGKTEVKVKTLHEEILSLKQTRVRVLRQMREESDKFRQWKQSKDKEVAKLKQQDRRRQFEMVRLAQTHTKQQNVMKRKMDAALAANKRLKIALQVRANLNDKRKGNKDEHLKQSAKIEKWLKEEMDVIVSSREAAHYLNFLLEDRKATSGKLNLLKKRLDNSEPPKKRVAWDLDSSTESVEEPGEEDIRDQIESLEKDLELRSAQIADLQQKIIDADEEEKSTIRWDHIQNMADAKHALKCIFHDAVTNKVDSNVRNNELADLQTSCEEMTKTIQQLKRDITRLDKEHRDEKTRILRENEEKVLFILRSLPKVCNDAYDEPADVEKSLLERLRFQEEEITNLSAIYEDFEKKMTECEELKKELKLVACKGTKRSLMPELCDFQGSPAFPATPLHKPKAIKKSKPKVCKIENVLFEDEVEDDTDCSDDDSNDPDWRLTPHANRAPANAELSDNSDVENKHKRKSQKRSSGQKCNCRGTCKFKNCSCRKSEKACSDMCRCTSEQCTNRPVKSDEKNTSDLNGTFNISTTSGLPVLAEKNQLEKRNGLDKTRKSKCWRRSDLFKQEPTTSLFKEPNTDPRNKDSSSDDFE